TGLRLGLRRREPQRSPTLVRDGNLRNDRQEPAEGPTSASTQLERRPRGRDDSVRSAPVLPQPQHVLHERLVVLLADYAFPPRHPGSGPDAGRLLDPELQRLRGREVLARVTQVPDADAVVAMAGDATVALVELLAVELRQVGRRRRGGAGDGVPQ